MNKNIIITVLSICLAISLAYLIFMHKSIGVVNAYVTSQQEYSDLARSFAIEYNNMNRDAEHTDLSTLKSYCSEEFWESNFADTETPAYLPEKLEVNTNNIQDIVCQVSASGAKVVIHGTQTFEYASYHFVYLININKDMKVDAMTILAYS